MEFECDDYDVEENGRVIGRCVEWCEARPRMETLLRTVGGLLIVASCMMGMGGWIAWARTGSLFWLAVAGLGLLLSWLCFDEARNLSGRWRRVILRKDGRIECDDAKLSADQVASIANIEAEPTDGTHWGTPYRAGVRIVTRRGRAHHVARFLKQEDAAELAVVMSEAVNAVRYVDRSRKRQVNSGHQTEVIW